MLKKNKLKILKININFYLPFLTSIYIGIKLNFLNPLQTLIDFFFLFLLLLFIIMMIITANSTFKERENKIKDFENNYIPSHPLSIPKQCIVNALLQYAKQVLLPRSTIVNASRYTSFNQLLQSAYIMPNDFIYLYHCHSYLTKQIDSNEKSRLRHLVLPAVEECLERIKLPHRRNWNIMGGILLIIGLLWSSFLFTLAGIILFSISNMITEWRIENIYKEYQTSLLMGLKPSTSSSLTNDKELIIQSPALPIGDGLDDSISILVDSCIDTGKFYFNSVIAFLKKQTQTPIKTQSQTQKEEQ